MEISVIINSYMKSIGGLCCPICDVWDDSSKFKHGICSECDEEVQEVLKEAENY